MENEVRIEEKKTRVRQLIAKGREQGFLTYAEVNDHVPDGMLETDQIEDLVAMMNEMGIEVYETTPSAEERLLDKQPENTDEEETEEAAIALVTLGTNSEGLPIR